MNENARTGARATSEPEVTMSAVKLDRDGNVVETIPVRDVAANVPPGLLERLKRAVSEARQDGKLTEGDR